MLNIQVSRDRINGAEVRFLKDGTNDRFWGRRLHAVGDMPTSSGIEMYTGCETNAVTNLGKLPIVNEQDLHLLTQCPYMKGLSQIRSQCDLDSDALIHTNRKAETSTLPPVLSLKKQLHSSIINQHAIKLFPCTGLFTAITWTRKMAACEASRENQHFFIIPNSTSSTGQLTALLIA